MAAEPSTPLEIRLYDALKRIARDYQTPDQIRRSAEKDHGLTPCEALEYAYDNIQQLAGNAIRGVRIRRPQNG